MIDALVNIGISILIGIIFILAAIILQKNPPTDINAAYGYRTKRSMKNKELWDAGNRYSAEVMKREAEAEEPAMDAADVPAENGSKPEEEATEE